MSWIRKCGMLVFLTLWGMATLHCALEQVPGFGFLASCHSADAAPLQDNDCDSDGCAAVESGFYKMEEQAAHAPVPLLVLSFLLPAWEATTTTVRPQVLIPNCSPPELPRVWQFSHRTALSPRAPSLVA